MRLNAQWTLCALWEKKLSSVRGKTPQWLAWVLSYREGAFYFSQIYTDKQNTQGFTETLSQPISQNLTPIFSWNALCSLYAGGVLCARNVRQKAQWTLCALWEIKLPRLREKTPHASCKQPKRGNLTYNSPLCDAGVREESSWGRPIKYSHKGELPPIYSIISASARGTKKACYNHAADFQTNTLCF